MEKCKVVLGKKKKNTQVFYRQACAEWSATKDVANADGVPNGYNEEGVGETSDTNFSYVPYRF